MDKNEINKYKEMSSEEVKDVLINLLFQGYQALLIEDNENKFNMFHELVDNILTILPPSKRPEPKLIYTPAFLMVKDLIVSSIDEFASSVNENLELTQSYVASYVTCDLHNLLFLKNTLNSLEEGNLLIATAQVDQLITLYGQLTSNRLEGLLAIEEFKELFTEMVFSELDVNDIMILVEDVPALAALLQ